MTTATYHAREITNPTGPAHRCTPGELMPYTPAEGFEAKHSHVVEITAPRGLIAFYCTSWRDLRDCLAKLADITAPITVRAIFADWEA